jgi:putative transposase
MKGKRYTTEEKIRILRETDKGVAIAEVCREHNLSQVTFHRWKRQFGQMEVKEARRLKDLERENGELKKMLLRRCSRTGYWRRYAKKNCKPRGIGGRWPRRSWRPGCGALGERCAGSCVCHERRIGIVQKRPRCVSGG